MITTLRGPFETTFVYFNVVHRKIIREINGSLKKRDVQGTDDIQESGTIHF